jgi:hypothetical protein
MPSRPKDKTAAEGRENRADQRVCDAILSHELHLRQGALFSSVVGGGGTDWSAGALR